MTEDPGGAGAADADLGLAELAPVELPDELFEKMLSVAVDPATPAVDPDLVPGAGDEPGDPGEVDLADLDDEPGETAVPPPESGDGDDDEESQETEGDPLAGLDDPAEDPFAEDPAVAGTHADDPADAGAYDEALPEPDPYGHDDPGV